MSRAVTVLPVHGLGEVRPGDDLAALIAAAAELQAGDVVVVSQKVISKAEGALAPLAAGEDVAAARRRLAKEQAADVVVDAPEATIVRTAAGLVCANAGIDASNAPPGMLVLLPDDSDASARQLREALARLSGVRVAVVVSDTFGRPWRLGQTDVAIGLAGLPAFRDERGGSDRRGKVLEVTQVALADEVAAAADLVRRKADGVPVVVVRGLDDSTDDAASARQLCRGPEQDLFARGRGRLSDLLGGAPPRPLRVLRALDLERAVAAALRAGGSRVSADLREGSRQIVLSAGTVTEDLVALGAASATLVAALVDFGGSASATAPRVHASTATVVVNAAHDP